MLEVAEISRRMSGSKNAPGYINRAFIIDPSDEGKKDIENCSADDDKEKEASAAPKGVLAIIRQSRWMLPLVYTHIWMSASFSIMQPYFPPLAAAAGLEAWKYGFFFSATKVAMLLGSVLNERLMAIASPRKCYLSGQIGFLLFTILLGLMYWSPGGDIFLGLCLVLALIGGFFSTVYVVSAYTVVTAEFPVHTGLIISTVEFLWGSGSMIGCGISGLLIDAWAYPLPFFVLALLASFSLPWTTRSQRIPDKPLKGHHGIHVRMREHGWFRTWRSPNRLVGIPSAIFCPGHHNHPVDSLDYQAQEGPEQTTRSSTRGGPDAAQGSEKKLYRLLWDPLFMVNMVTLMLSWVIMGFNEPTLEPYLRQFNLSSTRLGVLYMVQFASYTVGAAFAGLFCYVKMAAFFAFAGQLMTAFAYLILGPAPFVQQDPQLWMVYVSQTFTGVGMAAQFICSFSLALSHTAKRGYPDDIRTTGFVSTVVVTFLVIGAITTPPIAGYLVEKFSYRPGSMFLFGILLFWTPITLLHWIYLMYIQRTRSADVALQDRSISSRKS
ncbi:uncharacterized protein LOC119397681 [Rhipicephalus sanguineus]|uniref:uncharacterized protein LOC119397681 n=1 Tax=Rhipicephalus sanguineus TaxID=34632 RepID=UPI0020C39CB5|nr:uncharacterized protein LOC119397681 [Rhipicephalus sanguineus]